MKVARQLYRLFCLRLFARIIKRSKLTICFGLGLSIALSLKAGELHFRANLENTRASSESPKENSSPPGKVTSLSLKVITESQSGAGTNNSVYFDIGPLAWQLEKSPGNDFQKGRTYTCILKIPENIILTKDDILWLRLHKKGIAGVTGTGDGFDGAWHPETITLVVDGHDYPTLSQDTPLNSRCWYWRSTDLDDSDLKVFARSLRMQPNKELKTLDKVVGILTTSLFKRTGISGWLRNPKRRECEGNPPHRKPAEPLPAVCATGEVTNQGRSTDGLETIDLRVTKIELAQKPNDLSTQVVFLDRKHGFEQPRYLRVENRYAHHRVTIGEVGARICGAVRWDTDREGWWEIHPRNSSDLPPASK